MFKLADYCFTLINDNNNLRIALSYADKLEVVYDKNYGAYTNEVVMNDGTRIRVLL